MMSYINSILIEDKPTYKISPSLINGMWRYKNKTKQDKRAFDDFVVRLRREFNENQWSARGKDFEKRFQQGEYENLNVLLSEGSKTSVYGQKVLEFNKLNLKINGICDVINEKNKVIIDLKRVNKVDIEEYNNSVQHLIYFYLFDNIDKFYYIFAIGSSLSNEKEELEFKALYYERPDNLEEILNEKIVEFFIFLEENNLIETYKEFNTDIKLDDNNFHKEEDIEEE